MKRSPRLLLVTVLGLSSANVFAGLVGYYPFNGNANDESGKGNHGVVVGAQLGTDRFGNTGNSYVLTGAGQYVETSSSVGFPSGLSDFSVSLWVSLTGLIADHQILFANSGVNQLQLDIWPSSGNSAPIEFMTGGDYPPFGQADVHTSDVLWVPNQWYNIQIVRSADTVTIYRDGSVIGQNSTAQGNDAQSLNLRFGLGVPPQAHQLYGQLDDIRIYDRALSSEEVGLLYATEAVVPEPSTFIAGALLAVPFGVQAIRRLRNRSKVS